MNNKTKSEARRRKFYNLIRFFKNKTLVWNSSNNGVYLSANQEFLRICRSNPHLKSIDVLNLMAGLKTD